MNNKLLLSGLFSLLMFSSCEDLLTEKPNSSYDSNLLFSTVEGAEMALNGAFATLSHQKHYGQFEMSAMGSDDICFIKPATAADNAHRDVNFYRPTTINTVINDLWVYKYDGINRTNHIIAQIQKMPEYSQQNEKLLSIEGQARFLRALLGYDIVRHWGDAPFKTTFSAVYEDAYQPKQSREYILDQVVEDLTIATQRLKWATATSNPERPTQGAARALLMRVYLSRAGYYFPSTAAQGSALVKADDATCDAYYDRIIAEFEAFEANGFHDLCPKGYEQFWKNFCEKLTDPYESLYEIAFHTPDGNPAGASLWGTYIGPETNENSSYNRANAFFRVVRDWAKFYYDANDIRKDVNVCNYTINANDEVVKANDYTYFPGKWRREWMTNPPKDRNNVDVNLVYLRYADVLLMAAEAYNERGNSIKAIELIDKIRERANAKKWENNDQNFLDNYVTGKWELLDEKGLLPYADLKGKVRRALYWERGFEFCYEGTRKQDLLRWGIIRDIIPHVYSPNKAGNSATNTYSADLYFVAGKSELFPIPQKEMSLNYKITENNPGY